MTRSHVHILSSSVYGYTSGQSRRMEQCRQAARHRDPGLQPVMSVAAGRAFTVNSGKRRVDRAQHLAPPAVGARHPARPHSLCPHPSRQSMFLEHRREREGRVSCPRREITEELTTQNLSDAELSGSSWLTLAPSKQ